MPIPVKILHADGNLTDAPIEAETLNEVAQREPEGVYTVARTFHRSKAFLFNAHLERLEESAWLERIKLNLNRESLRKALAGLIEESEFPESRFRITVPKAQPDEIWLATEPLTLISPEMKKAGVRVATCTVTRPNPKAKSNAWVNLRNRAAKGIPANAYEGIILSDSGYLVEGFSSNFYAIIQGTLFTAEQEILHGIARQVVLTIAPELITLQFQPIHADQIGQIDEAFMTSSSRGIVPIVQIDELQIANGAPGGSTQQLSARYDAWVEDHIEPLWSE